MDRLIEEYGVETVERAMRPLLTDERVARLERVLDARLASFAVVLENLHDPHNGAAAIRSIEAFGLAALHVIENTEPFRFSPAVTIGCEKWITVHRHADFAACSERLGADGMVLYAMVPGAERDLETIAVDRPFALLFGNEHEGLTEESVGACDERVSLPMFGFTRSFNLSVSVALATQRLAARRREAIGADGDLESRERARLRARWYALSVRGAEKIVRHYVSNETRGGVGSQTQPSENH